MKPKKRAKKTPLKKAPVARIAPVAPIANETHWIRPDLVRIMKVEPDAILPTRAHPDDAGMDLYSLEDVELVPGQGRMVKTGIAMALTEGYVGLVADRSSMAKRGVKTAGGVIDAGYRGQIQIVLWNISNEFVQLKRHERIAQLLILPVATPAIVEVKSLGETARGEKGFGSTGR